MTNLARTQSETIMKDGIEYNTYPPPPALVKVMEYRWATDLISIGSMHFGSLESYRKYENIALGDPNDGKGMFLMEGHSYTVDSSNNIYAWCASLPDITPGRIVVLAGGLEQPKELNGALDALNQRICDKRAELTQVNHPQ